MRIPTFSFLTSVVFSLTCLSISAQEEFQIDLGPRFKEKIEFTVEEIIGLDETGFYTVKDIPRGNVGFGTDFRIEKFDFDMNLIQSNEIELKIDRRKGALKRVVQFHDNIYLLTEYREGESNFLSVYLQDIDKRTLDQGKKRKKLADIPINLGIGFDLSGPDRAVVFNSEL